MEIEDLKNLGKKSADVLSDAGIQSANQLLALGPVASFLAVRNSGQKPSLNLLWAIAAAVSDIHWLKLSSEQKGELEKELNSLSS